jgi:very-short-patch-repair endonuclease
MAAVLACGEGAVLSHGSAAALWGIGVERGEIEVAVPSAAPRSPRGVRVRRRPSLRAGSKVRRHGIPVTDVVQTLVDLAARLGSKAVERAVNEADRLDHVSPPQLRRALVEHRGERGVDRLRRLLDHRTFRLTREELERRFLPLAARAGLPVPLTKQIVNEFEVDFWWPELKLVVETDGLRYHRTPAEQARDRLRDQTHTAAGLVNLRFTHEQVRYEPDYVLRILTATAALISRP